MPWALQNSGILSARRGVGGTAADGVRDFGMRDSLLLSMISDMDNGTVRERCRHKNGADDFVAD
jgi:hypothetical protein